MFCPKCGTENADGANFCQKCGSKMPAAEMGAPPASSVAAPATAAPLAPPAALAPSAARVEAHVATLEYAGFWRRLAASIIDALPILLLIAVTGGFHRPGLFEPGGGGEHRGGLIRFLLIWLYFALMESSTLQGTLGKLAVGLRVTDLNGNRIGFGRATGRYFGKIVSIAILCVGFFMAAFTEKKQGLHDLMAGTLVVVRK